MVEFKLTLSDPKTGKSYKKVATEEESKIFKNTKIGSKIDGSNLNVPGYEFQITGGSDTAGFPMRADLNIIGRRKPLLTTGIGLKATERGIRKRKTVVGSNLSEQITQINLKIVKHGTKTIEEILGIKTEEAPQENKEAHKEHKEEKHEKKEEAPKEHHEKKEHKEDKKE